MRVNLARAALSAALLSAITLAAAPAGAGGPTSALLSVPGAGSTASLYYTDPEYDELARLVGVTEPSGTFDGEESAGHEFGAGVTVTWLIHDVQPWRVDRIYLGGKGGPWIATQVSVDGDIWESLVLWHQPADGARLADLLDGLGLGTAASKDPGFDGVPGAAVDQGAGTNAVAPSATEPAPAAEAGPAWGRAAWALGGLLGGLLAGALVTLAWTRRRTAAVDESPPSAHGSDGYVEVLAR